MTPYKNQDLEDGLYIAKLSIALGGSDHQLRSFRNGKWEGLPSEIEVLEFEKTHVTPAFFDEGIFNQNWQRKGGPEHEEFERKHKRG